MQAMMLSLITLAEVTGEEMVMRAVSSIISPAMVRGWKPYCVFTVPATSSSSICTAKLTSQVLCYIVICQG